MKFLFFLLFTIIFSPFSYAQTSQDYIKKGKTAMQKMQEKQALDFYKKALKINPTHIEALSYSSLLCANIGHRSNDSKFKKSYYEAAIIYARDALKVNSKNADANFAMAVAYGRKVYTIMSPKPRIAMSAKIKKYAEQAVLYNPNDYKALTLLGMWHYERATLTFAEKKIVAFLGGLPNGSLQNARNYLEKSLRLNSKNIATYLELGKVYKEIGKKQESIKTWQKALALMNQYQDDNNCKKEIRARLARI